MHEKARILKFIDLFAGVGGFALGIERAGNNLTQPAKRQSEEGRNRDFGKQSALIHSGQHTAFRCIGFSEIDKYAIQVYQKHFPGHQNLGDAKKIDAQEIPAFDLLCGGFPCQAFSIAGKRRGFKDTRGTVFFEITRILAAKRPRFIFLENVKGLLNHEKGKTFAVIIQTLEKLGYELQWMVLNSKFFGVPQNRERVFIIGDLRGESMPEILPLREDEPLFNCKDESGKRQSRAHSSTLKGAAVKADNTFILHNFYGGLGEERPREFRRTIQTIRTPKGGGHLPMIVQGVAFRTRTYSGQEGHIEIRKDGVSNQLTTVQKDSMVLSNKIIRRLTPVECERLQGFPDGWTSGFSDTQRYKMMGNAVTVNVIESIIRNWFLRKI